MQVAIATTAVTVSMLVSKSTSTTFCSKRRFPKNPGHWLWTLAVGSIANSKCLKKSGLLRLLLLLLKSPCCHGVCGISSLPSSELPAAATDVLRCRLCWACVIASLRCFCARFFFSIRPARTLRGRVLFFSRNTSNILIATVG